MSITLLRAPEGRRLAKVWPAGGGDPEAAANVTWFEARQIAVRSLGDVLALIQFAEPKRRVAMVRETIAPGADPKRLRRTCAAGVDKHGEAYPAGLCTVPTDVLVLDIEKLPLPKGVDWRDGDALAEYARGLLPDALKRAGCVWQVSGSAGHPSKRGEVRLHLFFVTDEAVLPKAWKPMLAHLPFIDHGAFDNAKLIFTAAPVILSGADPLTRRHGVLSGDPVVCVPEDVKAHGEQLVRDAARPTSRVKPMTGAPMPEAMAVFVEIVAASNVLRSRHGSYCGERARRLSFCAMIAREFGVTDEDVLAEAFHEACVGADDPNGEHDAQQALAWVWRPSTTGREYTAVKLLHMAAGSLVRAGKRQMACRAMNVAAVLDGEQE